MTEKLTTFPTMQLVDGKFVPAQEICLAHAKKTFAERLNGDTNPQIVQMKLRGQPIPHWYYRSDQWVDQPYFKPSEFLQPFVGPTEQANPGLFGDDTYEIDHEMTDVFRRKHDV